MVETGLFVQSEENLAILHCTLSNDTEFIEALAKPSFEELEQ
jgi:hypothetical protein